jgi:hypothetical protein
MRPSWRDGLAPLLVGVGAGFYLVWLAGVGSFGPRIVAGVIFGLGLAASVVAVVYGFGAGLLRAPKWYLAVASLFGLTALVAGLVAIVSADEVMLAILVPATVGLWLMSTVRHTRSLQALDAGVHTSIQALAKAA